jgi:hypothetical protein
VRPGTDEQAVSARAAAAIPRLVVIVAAGLFATATITFAAGKVAPSKALHHKSVAKSPHVLVVPDVRQQVFVFAKGMLEDEGFGWRVKGAVHGYPSNIVVSQSPAPRARIVDNGAPAVTLELSRNPKYAEVGKAEDRSPYGASAVRVFGSTSRVTKRRSEPSRSKSAPAMRHLRAKAHTRRTHVARRQPAFFVPGAPREPVRELALPVRAQRLGTWLEHHRRPTTANVRHWSYQHAWVVTGANFGWSGGAKALGILIRVDRRAERFWGIGSSSRQIAEQALRSVRARSR